MARINGQLLVQRVGDDRVVLMDESTDNEVVIPMVSVANVVAALAYLTGDPYTILEEAGDLLEPSTCGEPAPDPLATAFPALQDTHDGLTELTIRKDGSDV